MRKGKEVRKDRKGSCGRRGEEGEVEEERVGEGEEVER